MSIERAVLDAICDPELVNFAAAHELNVRAPSPHHIQVLDEVDAKRVVFAEWWPTRGTTRYASSNGRKCKSVGEFIAWLKDI